MAFCQKCGSEFNSGDTFCTNCGTPVTDAAAAVTAPSNYNEIPNTNNYRQQYAPQQNNAPVYTQPAGSSAAPYGSEVYKPMGAWAYFGYSLLFSIPIVGLIVNLVLCFNKTNINKRNYARSFWCWYVIVIITIIIASVSGASLLSLMDI